MGQPAKCHRTESGGMDRLRAVLQAGGDPSDAVDGQQGHRCKDSSPIPPKDTSTILFSPEQIYIDIARRTRTLEIVGLWVSLFALVISLLIFCTFRSLRNNRTKIHKNLFVAMVLQVIVRLTLYLDQYRRGNKEAATNTSLSAIENTVGLYGDP